MKKDLQEIILNSVPKEYHKSVKSVIDKYDSIEETYNFRISLLIILASIVILLLFIFSVLLEISYE